MNFWCFISYFDKDELYSDRVVWSFDAAKESRK